MNDASYLPLDSIVNPNNPMAAVNMHVVDPLLEKLPSIEVSVAEISPESPQAEFDMLTMRNPALSPKPVTVIKGPPRHHGGIRSPSPTGSVRSSFSSTRRRVTRRSGFVRSHRSSASKELTLQAESEFLGLMELMSGISRRSSSLKEVWMKIISERELFALEMDRMYEQFEEYTETIERHERERHGHNHELDERKKEVTKLRLELTAAVSATAGYKKKLHDCEGDLGKARSEIAELKDVYKYLKEEHEETKRSLEETQLKLVASVNACHDAEEDARRHHGELETMEMKYLELQSSHTELTTKFELTHKEIISLKQTNSVYKKEKEEWLCERGELEDRVRKCGHRCDELKRKVKEITESFEKKKHELTETIETKKHELHETKEKMLKYKHEKEELHQKVKELRIEVEEEHKRWDEAEDRCGKWRLKCEQLDREVTSVREEIHLIQIERTELQETVTKKTEEHRLLIIEKKKLEKEHHGKCKESDDRHREILVLQETLRRTESTLKEKSELIHTLHERIERIERDRDEARGRCGTLEAELVAVQTAIVALKLEIETVTDEREHLREKCHECETKYEEICETISEHHESSSRFEYEITSLRSMLREAREEREKAISLRIAADRERDESTARYEAKCREMERLEESFSHRYHISEDRSETRSVNKRFVSESSS